MLYLSEQTGKSYKTIEELQAAEAELAKAEAEKKIKSEQKKLDAKIVENAWKNKIKVHKECAEKLDEADKAYEQALAEFKQKYPDGYHMCFRDGDTVQQISYNHAFNLFKDWDDIYKTFFNFII